LPESKISSEVKDFIFRYIDSVEQLEILLLLGSDPGKAWTSEELSHLLRSSPHSVEKRLEGLRDDGLIQLKDEKEYFFDSQDQGLVNQITKIAEIYKVQLHGILALVFSPMKKGRDFADAFKLGRKDSKGDQDD